MKREGILAQSWASAGDIDNLLGSTIDSSLRAMPIRTRLRPALRDPDDDMVLECAVQSGATAIVTMNERDFRAARDFYRIELIKPGELLTKLRYGAS